MKYENHIVTVKTVTVILSENGQEQTAIVSKHADPARYQAAVAAINKKQFDSLPAIMDIAHAMKMAVETGGDWKTEGEQVYYAGIALPKALSRKFLAMSASGVDVEPIKKFWVLLLSNPQEVSRNSLFTFIEKNGSTITEDGHFILYKGIRADWTSLHDQKTPHRCGEYLPRLTYVDLDPRVSCGRGYHAAPWQYVRSVYSYGIIIEVKINPADVISVPHEDCQKIRCYTYKVVRQVVNGDDPRVIQKSNLKTGDLADPKPGLSLAAKTIHAVKGAIKKVMRRTGLVIEASTDRITIPGSCVLEHGFQSNGTATVWVTDPRSRFLLICPTPMFASLSKTFKVHWSKEVVVLSTGSLSIRSAVLSSAKIWNGPSSKYRIEQHTTKIIEVRPV